LGEVREWAGKGKGVKGKEGERVKGGNEERGEEGRTKGKGKGGEGADTIICPGPRAREGWL